MSLMKLTTNHHQAERQSNLIVESGQLDVSPSDSSHKSYGQQEEHENKESCHHFGLDLDLPHPDHYMPETGSL